MPNEIRRGASFELSTSGLGPSQGLSSLRDLFDQKVQLELRADPDQRVDARMTVHGLPGLRYATMDSSMDVALFRHRAQLSDREDDLCLILNTGKALSISQGGHEACAQAGDAVLLDYRETGQLCFRAMSYAAIRVPHAALAPFTRSLGSRAGRHIPGDTAALRLLRDYLASVPKRIGDPALGDLIARHVYDLMALAIGATRDAADHAAGRSLKAVQLQAIQTVLSQNTRLSLAAVASRLSVSPRYVQKLFEDAGTTFTGFVLDLRLEAARSMLASPRYRHWKILAIAEEAGFGDLSYFNRRFRARYGVTPSEHRALLAAPGTVWEETGL
jgi:AraC-like DNA-binding protein